MLDEREIDEDERREAIEERRAMLRMRRCECRLDGYPGSCPGPAACPYSDYVSREEEDDRDADD